MKVAGAPISWGVSELVTWGHRMAPERVLAEMQQLGLDATELGPPGYLPADARTRAELLRRHGMRIVAGFLSIVLHEGPQAARVEIQREATMLAESGAEVMVVAAALPGDSYDSLRSLDADGWTRLVESLSEGDAIVSSQGMTLAFHPHAGTAIATAEDVRMLLERTGVALCLDTGHLFLGGLDPAEIARDAAARIRHVHLKDVRSKIAGQVMSGQVGYAEAVRRGLYAPLGQGDLDIEDVVTRLRLSGYQGWFVLEQDTALTAEPEPHSGPSAAARESLEYFRHIAGAMQTTSASKEE